VAKTVQTGLAISALPLISNCGKDTRGILPKRHLGRTGENLSVIGFGGIIVSNVEQDEANNRVARAIDAGCNYFDVIPSYGNAEDMLGPALEPYRQNCFLACKTQKRDAVGAEEELNTSLKKMRTDHFDLYQLHAISSVDDVEKAFGPAALEKAWYVPIEDEGICDLSLRFTFSRGITAAIPPGEYKFWNRAVNIALKSTDISEGEIAKLQETAKEIEPLFRA